NRLHYDGSGEPSYDGFMRSFALKTTAAKGNSVGLPCVFVPIPFIRGLPQNDRNRGTVRIVRGLLLTGQIRLVSLECTLFGFKRSCGGQRRRAKRPRSLAVCHRN